MGDLNKCFFFNSVSSIFSGEVERSGCYRVEDPGSIQSTDIYGLLAKLVRSRWLDIGQVRFLRV